MLTNELLYNSVALMHANKKADMKADLNKVLEASGLTVDGLLKLSGSEFLQTNANEVMGTGQTGFGKEWVETVVLSAELIERIGNSSSLLSKIGVKQMLAKVMEYPVRGARIKMIGTTENTDQPQNKTATAAQVKKLGTPTVQLTAEEFVVTVYVSDTLLEDAVLAIAEYVVSEIVSAFEYTAHNLILNGDTATTSSTNVNAIDGAVTALPDGAKDDTLKADGARKVAIANGATVDAGSNLDLSVFRTARAKMGIKGLNPAEIVAVIEQNSYFELLNLSEVETIEKFGDAATVKNGRLTAIDGIEIMNREELGLAKADGTVSVADASLNDR